MKTCVNCGAQNSDEAIFCAHCGGALQAPETHVEQQAGMPPAQAAAPQGQPVPPPPYGMPAAPSPPPAPYGAPYPPVPYPAYYRESNGKATASLVLGIVGLFVCPLICSAIALILGSQAKKEIAASGGMMSGESAATAGIVLGWVGIALSLVAILIWVILIAVASSQSTMLPALAGAL